MSDPDDDVIEIYGYVNMGANTVDLMPHLGLLSEDEEVAS